MEEAVEEILVCAILASSSIMYKETKKKMLGQGLFLGPVQLVFEKGAIETFPALGIVFPPPL